MKKAVRIFVLLIVGITACSEKKTDEVDYYSIKLGDFETSQTAENYLNKLNSDITDTLFTHKSGEKYSVQLGKFDNIYDASEKGYNLFNDSLINKYEVVKGDSLVSNPEAEILFIGIKNKTSAIYSFNLVRRDFTKVWNLEKESVKSIDFMDDLSNYIFLTNSDNGKTRIYYLDKVNYGVDLIKEFDTEDHIYTDFIDENKIKLKFTNGGKEPIKIIDLKGDLIKFDKELTNNLHSPGKKYEVIMDNVAGLNNLYIKEPESKRKFLTSTDQIIKKVGWAEGSGKLFVLTVDNGDNSNIFIFNIEKAEMENVLSHKNIREFIVKDDLLIFDRGNNKNSEIILYNFENNKTIYTIELPGGCSLSNLSVN